MYMYNLYWNAKRVLIPHTISRLRGNTCIVLHCTICILYMYLDHCENSHSDVWLCQHLILYRIINVQHCTCYIFTPSIRCWSQSIFKSSDIILEKIASNWLRGMCDIFVIPDDSFVNTKLNIFNFSVASLHFVKPRSENIVYSLLPIIDTFISFQRILKRNSKPSLVLSLNVTVVLLYFIYRHYLPTCITLTMICDKLRNVVFCINYWYVRH